MGQVERSRRGTILSKKKIIGKFLFTEKDLSRTCTICDKNCFSGPDGQKRSKNVARGN
jgi:hypothetical protein